MSLPSEADLIRRAVEVLRRRAAASGGYAGLSAAAAGGLCRTLTGIADDAPELDGVTREDAVCLAHRVLDDDHPEHSPLWPAATEVSAPSSPG